MEPYDQMIIDLLGCFTIYSAFLLGYLLEAQILHNHALSTNFDNSILRPLVT